VTADVGGQTGDPELAAWLSEWPVRSAAAGVTDANATLASAGPVDREVRVASIAKLFTTLAVLVAVEEGSVSLEDPVGPPGSTLRHLLSHASGLAFDDDRVHAAPGRRRIYSNTGMEAAAAHVAEATGIPFGTYIREAVFEPMGLGATSLRGSPARDVYSTVTDLLTAGRHFLRPTVVHESTFATAVSPQFPELAGVLPEVGRFDPNQWGLGFELRDGKQPHWTGRTNSPSTFGHFGGTGTFLWVDPEADLACTAVSDRGYGPWALEVWPDFSDRVLARFAGEGRLRPGPPQS
jgi:CubicO group peptidase (beta-lactamase class C family)